MVVTPFYISCSVHVTFVARMVFTRNNETSCEKQLLNSYKICVNDLKKESSAFKSMQAK